jgi:hypothetical protein
MKTIVTRMPSSRVSQVILEQLAGGERRVLSLTVSVRNVLRESGTFKGDLATTVGAELRRLVQSRTIVDRDGWYSLASAK